MLAQPRRGCSCLCWVGKTSTKLSLLIHLIARLAGSRDDLKLRQSKDSKEPSHLPQPPTATEFRQWGTLDFLIGVFIFVLGW